MDKNEFSYKILRLSETFYEAYPNPPYKEILKKQDRPYNCLLIQKNPNYYICIPYRTEITHKYAYKFLTSERAKKHNSGLDYTKIIIISKAEYISNINGIIDNDEYNETVRNIKRIAEEAEDFVNDYINHNNKILVLNKKEYIRRYQFSPLQYFHNELGIFDEK